MAAEAAGCDSKYACERGLVQLGLSVVAAALFRLKTVAPAPDLVEAMQHGRGRESLRREHFCDDGHIGAHKSAGQVPL
jgi:hypothetical protein